MKLLQKYLVIFVILFVLRKRRYSCVSTEKTFSISLQSNEILTTDEWALYNDRIPKLTEFTICHWDKIRYFSRDINTLWTYCYIKSKSSSLYCIQMEYSLILSTANRHARLTVFHGDIMLSGEIIPFNHRSWNHICWGYSSITGSNRLYFNGELLTSSKLNSDRRFPIVEGTEDVFDAAFVVGQEQDEVRGGYTTSQLYSGEIAEINIWNYILEENDVTAIATCKDSLKGNVVSWDLTKWTINEAIIKDTLHDNLFCQDNKQLVIFPTRFSLHISKTLCSVHGGTIATPTSEEENNEIKDLVEKYPQCVDKHSTTYKNWGTLAWLGIKRIESVWYDVKEDDIIRPLNYTKWSVYAFWGETSVDCSYIRTDGTWMYELTNNGTCSHLQICTVCTIPNLPVFTLKGVCFESSINLNYYLNIDDRNQIINYAGYKRGNISFKDNAWIIGGSDHNVTLSTGHKMNYPVGRLAWNMLDDNCEMDETGHLSLSKCEFGEEYTCNSGHCIGIQKRCNGVKDCKDNSDEEDCHLIEIPNTYKKLAFPKRRQGSNTSVTLKTRVLIESINLIDTTEMVMEVTVKITMKWADGRLKFTNLLNHTKSLVPTKTVEKLWLLLDYMVHDTAIIGKRYSYTKDRTLSIQASTSPMPMDIVDPFENKHFDSFQNILELKQRYRIQYICTFYLKRFPFDEQNCNIRMHMELPKDAAINFIRDGNGATYEGPKIINQFEVDKFIKSSVGKDGKKIWFMYDISMRRLFMSQIISTIFPTCLLWLLGYFTLFIKVENFNNRFMGSVTSLLVLASLLGSINSGLPRTSYFKYIDLWFLWYITNIFLIIIYHILLDNIDDDNMNGNTINRVNSCNSNATANTCRTSRRKGVNNIAIVLFPLFTAGFNTVYLYKTLDFDIGFY